ncbi:MAG TPA: radical SAM protein [Bacteroidales bacterium]|jgi:MoaA/NifB/PqqE/SkfB family radical SAM enzyme|nr:radical SAM protein [Bacteroidales bacterium]
MSNRLDKYYKLLRLKKRWISNWLALPLRKDKVFTLNNSAIKSYQFTRHSGPEQDICYAPSRSIYFGFEGIVVPCCFNRDYIYGIYPKNSVKEIIESGQRSFLQNHLKTQDFSHGCKHCLNLIESYNFQGVEARLYDGLKHNKNNYPSEMIFELDNTCNLECLMCEGKFSSSILKNRDKKQYQPGPYDKEFVNQLIPYLKHLEVAKFLGGEPFLINLYYNIWDEIIKCNKACTINLQTNGTVFNDKIASLLERGKFQIGISIDSLKKERFEKIRKNANFEQVLKNLDKFIDYSHRHNTFVNLSVCPMKQNRDEIPEIVKFCNNKGIFVYFNTVYTKSYNLRELSSGELLNLLKNYKSVHLKSKSYISKRNISFFKSLISQIEDWYKQKKDEEIFNEKRLPYNKDKLLKLFVGNLTYNDTLLIEKINEALNELPDNEIFLSDAQISLLQRVNKYEFTNGIKNECIESIRLRLNNFLENCSLALPE